MLPPIVDYYQGLPGPVIAAMGVGATLTIVTIGIFFGNLGSHLKKVPKPHRTKTIYLLAIYQIVSISQFILILMPRSVALVETISVLSFGFGAMIFHSLLLGYVGGESNLIKNSQSDAFGFRVPPCCLLPFVKPGEVTKKKLMAVRLMILQFPVVHVLIYIFYNMRMIEDPTLSTVYFMPFMFLSIIPVIWGLNILIRIVGPIVPDYDIKGKYFMLQLVLLVCKIQPAIGDLIYNNVDALRQIKVEYPMTLEVYKNVIIATIILIQMVLLSWGAQSYYKTPRQASEVSGAVEPTGPNAQTTIAVIS